MKQLRCQPRNRAECKMDYMTRDIIKTQHNLYQPVFRLEVEWVYNS